MITTLQQALSSGGKYSKYYGVDKDVKKKFLFKDRFKETTR